MTDRLQDLLHRAAARPRRQPNLAALRDRASRRRTLRRLAGGTTVAAVLLLGSAAALSLGGPADEEVVLQEPPADAATPAPTPSPTPKATPSADPRPERVAAESEPDPATTAPSPTAGAPAPADEPEPSGPPPAETTAWYPVSLHEEIEPGARYASARAALDALVAAMRFADGATVTHGLSTVAESSATGWIRASGFRDDSVSGEELRVQLSRDDGGWFVQPAAEGRATCRRGVDQTEPSRCV